jgi:hypothetical protein
MLLSDPCVSQALCEELPGIDDALLVWEAASGHTSAQVAQEVLRAVAGGGASSLNVLHALLTRYANEAQLQLVEDLATSQKLCCYSPAH